MKQPIIYCAFMMLAFTGLVNAQSKHDANWVFGYKAGINFSNPDSIYSYETKTLNYENAGCISDSLGNLVFYISEKKAGHEAYEILNKNGDRFSNNDSLLTHNSITNGLLIIPLNNSNYFIFHLSSDPVNIFPYRKTFLYYSIVSYSNDSLRIESINNPLYKISGLDEKLTAVKHADGQSWWIFVSELIDVNEQTCSNTKIRFLLKKNGDIEGPFYQDVGNPICVGIGEMKFSAKGNKLFLCIDGNKVDIYDIDRCTGDLIFQKVFSSVPTPYSCEFSNDENFLYCAVSNWIINGGIGNDNFLKQYNLLNNQINQIWHLESVDTSIEQIEIAKDKKIYVTLGYAGISLGTYNYNKHKIKSLGVINSPDSSGLLCDFQPYQLQLQDTSRTTIGLPNMPNYNLSALSIYEADAGNDTIICTDTTQLQKVVPLGTPAVSGVSYQWFPNYNLSSDTTAEVLAYPDTTTMYYVWLTDSTLTNSCKTRLDSVYVEVKACNVSIDEQLTGNNIKIYPNPATQTITIQTENVQSSIKAVMMFDVAGKVVSTNNTPLPPSRGDISALIDLSALSNGLYFLQIEMSNGQRVVRKVVKE